MKPYLKIIFLLSLILSTSTNFSWAAWPCSREIAEKKVYEICNNLQVSPDLVLKNWKQKLIFQNCGNNYVWIQDRSSEIKMILHPIKQRLNNTIIGNQIDENKFPLFYEFDKAAAKNVAGAWVEYVWPKNGDDKSTPKTSFVLLCKLKNKIAGNHEVVVGSGIWKSDLK